MRRLHAAGVPILAGTDAPNSGTSYGAAMHRELELLVEGDPTREITATRAISGVWKAGARVDRDAFARQVAAALTAMMRSPAGLRDGLVSDFESGAPAAGIGSWALSADSYAGGTSTDTVEVVEGGANGSRHALSIRGTITDAVPYAWYGAMWSPGTQPMSPVDLWMYGGFSFRARSDGRTFRVMIFSQSKGFTPLTRTFTADAEWREIAFSWSDFGIDGTDVMGVLIAGRPQPGEFDIRVDDFRLH